MAWDDDVDYGYSNYDQSYGSDDISGAGALGIDTNTNYLNQQSTSGSPISYWNGEESYQEPQYNFGQWQQQSFDPNSSYMTSGIGQQNYSGYSTPMPESGLPQITNSSQDFLSRLFANPSMIAKGLGALFEGAQNKKYGSTLKNLASKLQSAGDPFASQRAQYQQLLQGTYTDPNVVLNRPEIRAQLAGMKQQMDAKDAAAGRRSQYADRENQLAIQSAGLVDKYRQQLAQLAGGNLPPNLGGLSSLMQQGALASTNGYLSPLASVLGNVTRTDSNENAIASVLEKFLKSR